MSSILRKVALGVSAVGLGGFAVALAWEYVWGQAPCAMCRFERWGFFLTGLTGLCTLLVRSDISIQRIMACMGTFLGATAVVFARHLGIQNKWLALPDMCRASRPLSPADLQETAAQNVLESCDTVPFTILGHPPSLYLLMLTLALCLVCLWGFARQGPRRYDKYRLHTFSHLS
jgi:disulfide bond formation protein DsbB